MSPIVDTKEMHDTNQKHGDSTCGIQASDSLAIHSNACILMRVPFCQKKTSLQTEKKITYPPREKDTPT